MSDLPTMAVPGDRDMVPSELRPVRSDAPPRVWTIRGLAILPAMIPLWLVPRRIGASLAAAPWRAAIAAHLVALLVGYGLVVWAESYWMYTPFSVTMDPSERDRPWPQISISEHIRMPFTVLVMAAHSQAAGGGSMPSPAVMFLLVELGVLLWAVVLMPFAAAGECIGPLFGRCLRLAWWSTTLAIPLGIGWRFAPRAHQWLGYQSPNNWQPVDFPALALFLLWWMFVLLRSGHRYAGPPAGPAWETRSPICESCGYIIAQIPRSTKCPECGRPVAESLPESRRPTAFASATSFRESLRSFWPTLRAAVFDKDFFRHLAVQRPYGRDRTFFFILCFLNGAIAFFGVFAIGLAARSQLTTLDVLSPAAVAACAVMIGTVILAGLAGSAAAIIGRRSVQSSAIVAFYAYASLQPFILIVLALALLCTAVFSNEGSDDLAVAIVLVIFVMAAIIAVIGAVLRSLRVLSWHPYRDTRRANG
jgi:hypothetical protein